MVDLVLPGLILPTAPGSFYIYLIILKSTKINNIYIDTHLLFYFQDLQKEKIIKKLNSANNKKRITYTKKFTSSILSLLATGQTKNICEFINELISCYLSKWLDGRGILRMKIWRNRQKKWRNTTSPDINKFL